MPGMNTPHAERIILIGPTGSGKTTVAAALAKLLGWPCLDTDALIERRAGLAIPEIFAREGEPRFRELEAEALVEALAAQRAVIATGAGIVEHAENLAAMRAAGWVVALSISVRAALRRMLAAVPAGANPADARPMLAGGDPLARLRSLDARRRDAYAQADATYATDAAAPDQVAARTAADLVARGLLPPDGAEAQTIAVRSSAGDYDVIVGWGALAALGGHLRALGLAPRVHVIADETVAALYRPSLSATLEAAGFAAEWYVFAAGEASKSRAQWARLTDLLAERRAERGEAVIALGGGVAGDLAGFVAATYLRGLPLIQVPTSLLAQVDAAIGGKVAIDHPRGKNLIGAFYPPRLVVADPAALLTLPERQRIEGWAEVIKHGVALDADYFALLEAHAGDLLALRPRETTEAVAHSAALKAGIVSRDERESGPRMLLNYGHTIAHAIETVAGYGVWLHGEAVAMGMAAEARLAQRMGLCDAALVARQDALLARFGLPIRLPPELSAEALMRAALWDKKVRGGRVRWALPIGLGRSEIVDDVPDEAVRDVLLACGTEAS
ncbi:MAG TPA: 3-dehydroquinate synthase [Ktedonobacterales bacterium]